MMYDVAIIGEGLAGMASALAACERGKTSIVVAQGEGNLTSTSGYIEMLGYYPTTGKDAVAKPREALERLISEQPDHPYAITGLPSIERSIRTFLEVMKTTELPYTGSLDANIPMVTAAGALLPAALLPGDPGDIAEAEEIIVACIKGFSDFYPVLAAKNLEKALKRNIIPLDVDCGIEINRSMNAYDIALFFEDDETGARTLEGLINALRPSVKKKSHLLFPAVLGIAHHREIHASMEKALECRVIEIPTLPPTMTGLRLGRILKTYLKNKGTEFIAGSPVSLSDLRDKKCIELANAPLHGRKKKIRAESYVLATGGILGGGFEVRHDSIVETVFGIPVSLESPRMVQNFFDTAGQPLARAGIAVNKLLQPLDGRSGEVLYENVFVAGKNIRGADPCIEKSGTGLSLVTGYWAGLNAAGGGAKQ
jgi:glycerol-3-phosphate dehydrogenase subunit B